MLKEDAFGYPSNYKVDVDLAVNKYLEILNSQLISTYCELDHRFRQAAFVLKSWMKTTDPVNKHKRLNSFSVYMILLAFMIHNKYIPNLQQHKSLSKVPFKYETQ